MFTKIIVPVDLEEAARRPLWFVLRLTRLAGIPVELLTVCSPGIDDRADHVELDQWATLLPTSLTTTTIVHGNDTAQAIVEHLAAQPDALVAMATNARGVLGERMFGSVSEDVLVNHVAPVLLFGPNCPSHPPSTPLRLVVSVDPSDEPDAVLEAARRWSDTFEGPTPVSFDLVEREGRRPVDELIELGNGLGDAVVALGSSRWTDPHHHHWTSTARSVTQRGRFPVLVVPKARTLSP